MKQFYYIFIALFWVTAFPQQSFAATMDRAELRATCQHIVNDVRTTLISRQEYMAHLTECAPGIAATFPAIEVECVNEGIKYWVDTLRDQNSCWDVLAGRVEALEADQYDLDVMGNLISDLTWCGCVQAMNMKLAQVSHGGFSFLKVWPDAKRIYEEDARILGDSMAALLPFMPGDYRRDYEKYKLRDVSTLKYKEDSGLSISVPGKGAIRCGNSLQVTTARGIQFVHPLDGIDVRKIGPTPGAEEVSLVHILSGSKFVFRVGALQEAEVNEIRRGYLKALEEFKQEQAGILLLEGSRGGRAGAGKGLSFEALKERRNRKKGPVSAVAVTPEALEASARAEEELLLAIGGPISPRPRKKKGSQIRDSRSIEPSVVTMAESSVTKLFLTDLAEADSLMSSDGSSISSSSTAMGEASVCPTKPGNGPPPHRVRITLAPIVCSIDTMDRERAARDGLSKGSIEALTTLLGESLEGRAVKDINTVRWKHLVDILVDLGFRHIERDVFMNDKKHSIHLHALHYDDYRMNYKLLSILFKQLAYYGFTLETLKGMIEGDAKAKH